MSRDGIDQEFKKEVINSHWRNIVYILQKSNSQNLNRYLEEVYAIESEGPMLLERVLNTNVEVVNAMDIELSMPEYCIELSEAIIKENPDLDPLIILIDHKQKLDLLFNYGANNEREEEIYNKYIDHIKYQVEQNPQHTKNMLSRYEPATLDLLIEQGILEAEDELLSPSHNHTAENNYDNSMLEIGIDSGFESPETLERETPNPKTLSPNAGLKKTQSLPDLYL